MRRPRVTIRWWLVAVAAVVLFLTAARVVLDAADSKHSVGVGVPAVVVLAEILATPLSLFFGPLLYLLVKVIAVFREDR
jgi:hypothetical protein